MIFNDSQTSICLFPSAVLARFELGAALGSVMCVISMVFDGCRRISRTFLHSSLVLIVFSLSCSLAKNGYRKASHGKRWRKTSLNKRYSFFLHPSEGLENWFSFLCSFSGWSPRRQTSKMTVWEISFNPREFLWFFSPFFSSISLRSRILQCFLIYFMLLLFFRGNNEEFLLKIITSPLHRADCAFFVHFSSLSGPSVSIVRCTTWKKHENFIL